MKASFNLLWRCSALLLGTAGCAALWFVGTDPSSGNRSWNEPAFSRASNKETSLQPSATGTAIVADPIRDTTDQPWVTNHSHGLKATIIGNGMACRPLVTEGQAWAVSILLDRIGRGDDWSEPNPDAATERIKEYMVSRHGAFDLEHVNNEAGIRQNFIVHRKLEGEGPLRVELRTEGDLVCTHAGADIFHFTDTAGIIRLRYADLHVWDANGDTLPAAATLEDDRIVLLVEDELAAYPITVDPLLTTAVWTMDGDQSNGEFGWSVSTAGDVNGDGYSDIIIGHHLFDNGQTNEGRVVVYHGSASGPASTPSWMVESNSAGAQMGYSVATAGDVNGDGYSDIIIGAPYLSNGNALEGRVSVYHGGPTGLPASPSWTFESGQDNAYLGRSVACAGDVNGDGYSDVIIGAPLFDNGQVDEGRVLVFHGSATGLAAAPAWTTESNQDGATAGASVASAGDVNGDGFSDIIYGAPLYDNGQTNEGHAVVHLGSAIGLSPAVSYSTEGNQASANAGVSVASAGDVNGDGYGDVVVGAPLYDNGQTDEGFIRIALGSIVGLSTTITWESNVANDQRGTSVACAGDVNGDGYADIIAGSIQVGGNGVASLFAGGTSMVNTPSPLLSGAQLNARFGRSVSSAGDVNGDGFSDVLVGAYFHDNPLTNEGQAYCFYGAPASINNAAPFTRIAGATFGRSVSSAGDVNGDGYSDIIIGEPDGRRAHVYHGTPNGPSAAPVRTYNEPGIQGFGYCVSTAGDVNGDGYSDVIVGSNAVNQVHVYHGSAGGLPAGPSWTANAAPASGAGFGFSLSSAGDVNGDG